MKLVRGAAAFGVAKKVYDVARRPENQARLKAAVAKVRERQARRSA